MLQPWPGMMSPFGSVSGPPHDYAGEGLHCCHKAVIPLVLWHWSRDEGGGDPTFAIVKPQADNDKPQSDLTQDIWELHLDQLREALRALNVEIAKREEPHLHRSMPWGCLRAPGGGGTTKVDDRRSDLQRGDGVGTRQARAVVCRCLLRPTQMLAASSSCLQWPG